MSKTINPPYAGEGAKHQESPKATDPAKAEEPMPVSATPVHSESHAVKDGVFVDAAGAPLLFQGKPIPVDQVFMAQATKPEGYYKAGIRFLIVPSEVVFKTLPAEKQANFLAARVEALVITRKG